VLVARRWHLEIQTPKGIKVSKQTSALETENKFSSTFKQKQKLDKNKKRTKGRPMEITPTNSSPLSFSSRSLLRKRKKEAKTIIRQPSPRKLQKRTQTIIDGALLTLFLQAFRRIIH
jgi:hypothetical protein